jgi:hypothetical protein
MIPNKINIRKCSDTEDGRMHDRKTAPYLIDYGWGSNYDVLRIHKCWLSKGEA